MREYREKELETAVGVLTYLHNTSDTPDDHDLLYEVKDSSGKVLLSNVEEVLFLESHGYIIVEQRHNPPQRPYKLFRITREGRKWLEVYRSNSFSRKLVRDAVLEILSQEEEEKSWNELLEAVRSSDPLLAIVTKDQILKASEYLHSHQLVSLDILPGDGGVMDFFAKVTAKGVDKFEGTTETQTPTNSFHISGVNNSNISLQSQNSKQVLSATEKVQSSRLAESISSLLERGHLQKLGANETRFRSYLETALHALDDDLPELAVLSATAALSIKEIPEAELISQDTGTQEIFTELKSQIESINS